MTFMQWLRKQAKRDDPIGDLARDAKADRRHKPKSRAGWQRFLQSVNACEGAKVAANEAWDEYEATHGKVQD